jgi:hypothetical protein
MYDGWHQYTLHHGHQFYYESVNELRREIALNKKLTEIVPSLKCVGHLVRTHHERDRDEK